jgi:hypothetical protein
MATGFEAAPEPFHAPLPNRPGAVSMRRVEAEADEMCSFVKHKANKHWHWPAMERLSRPIMALHVGDRRRDRAKQVWANLPAVDREQAIC